MSTKQRRPVTYLSIVPILRHYGVETRARLLARIPALRDIERTAPFTFRLANFTQTTVHLDGGEASKFNTLRTAAFGDKDVTDYFLRRRDTTIRKMRFVYFYPMIPLEMVTRPIKETSLYVCGSVQPSSEFIGMLRRSASIFRKLSIYTHSDQSAIFDAFAETTSPIPHVIITTQGTTDTKRMLKMRARRLEIEEKIEQETSTVHVIDRFLEFVRKFSNDHEWLETGSYCRLDVDKSEMNVGFLFNTSVFKSRMKWLGAECRSKELWVLRVASHSHLNISSPFYGDSNPRELLKVVMARVEPPILQ